MNATITPEQQQAIADKLATMHLPKGIGDKENACSIAAINLALTGELTDDIPACMSSVIGRWIIEIQDRMPDGMRNSLEWKALLPFAAGTGREREKERLALILDWMWDALALLQPTADAGGYGAEWATMLRERTSADAADAADAAVRAAAAAARAADAAARAADAAAAYAADAADAADAAYAYAAARAVARAADAAAAYAAADAAYAYAAADAAARAVARAVAVAYAAAVRAASWPRLNPPALLRKLIEA